MNLFYIKQRYLDRLIRNTNRLEEEGFFKRGDVWLEGYFVPEEWKKESHLVVGETPDLISPESRTATQDLKNSKVIYEWLRGLNPAQASDPRLWTYLIFVPYWTYMQSRWPVADSNIEDRYFLMRKNTRCLVRNGIARLWWFAHLTYDSSRLDPYELTAVLLSSQDIQQSFLERSFGKNNAVLHGALDFIRQFPEKLAFIDKDHKKAIQGMAKRINQLGGVRLLDSLNKDDVINYLLENL